MEEILDIDSGVSMSPIAPFYANYLIFFYTRYAAMNPNTRSLISPVYSKHRLLTLWRDCDESKVHHVEANRLVQMVPLNYLSIS